jgi:hypothetical protein
VNPGIAGTLRTLLLAFGLSSVAAGVAALLGESWIEGLAEGEAGLLAWAGYLLVHEPPKDLPPLAYYCLFFGGMLLAQWLFLRPRGDWTVPLAEQARPMKSAIAVAAFMAALLSIGAIAVAVEPFNETAWWALLADASDWLRQDRSGELPVAWYALLLGAWALWAAIFWLYWREAERFSQLGRMIAGLIAGSFLELLVAIGVYAWDPHKEECWCARGSFTGIVFGATVMIWAFGPGLLLLFLRRQRERNARKAARGSA